METFSQVLDCPGATLETGEARILMHYVNKQDVKSWPDGGIFPLIHIQIERSRNTTHLEHLHEQNDAFCMLTTCQKALYTEHLRCMPRELDLERRERALFEQSNRTAARMVNYTLK